MRISCLATILPEKPGASTHKTPGWPLTPSPSRSRWLAPPGGCPPHPASAPSKKANTCVLTQEGDRVLGNCSGALMPCSCQVCEFSPLLFLIQTGDKPRICSVHQMASSEGPEGSGRHCHLQMLGRLPTAPCSVPEGLLACHIPFCVSLWPSSFSIPLSHNEAFSSMELWVTPSTGGARPLLPKEAPEGVFWKGKKHCSPRRQGAMCFKQLSPSVCGNDWKEDLGQGKSRSYRCHDTLVS